MPVINIKRITDFLEKENVHFELKGIPREEYKIASIFDPVENGFYFFLGYKIPDTIVDSLLIVNEGTHLKPVNKNAVLCINSDPQRVFYKLLSESFRNQSTGVISPTAIIDPDAVIGKNVQIDHFSVIGKAVIGDNTIIENSCHLHDNSVIGANTTLSSHSVIGTRGVAWIWNENETNRIIQPQLGGVIIGDNCFLGANTIVVRGSLNESSVIGESTLMAPGCRIGHGTRIGKYVHLANNVVTGGNTRIGDYCFVGSGSIFRPKVKIHNHTTVGAGAVIVKNSTSTGKTLKGVPALEEVTKNYPSGMPKPKKIA